VSPPGISSTTFTRRTKITAGRASTPQQRQQIADDQAHGEAAAQSMAAYGVTVGFAGVPVEGNESILVYDVTYTARPLPGSALR
jgi:hypothetical protein